MIDLPYSLVIEATNEPDYFGFYSEELEGFYRRNLRTAEGIGELLDGAELEPHPLLGTTLSTIRDWAYHVTRACGPGWFSAKDVVLFQLRLEISMAVSIADSNRDWSLASEPSHSI